MTAIVLLGPPGAGKGTVAEVLVEKGYTHISTGELLREQIRLGTPLGLKAKNLLDLGKFVSDEIVVGMMQGVLKTASAGQKFLFDGFPRTLLQAEKLDELMGSLEGKLSDVILLACPEELIIERLSGRRTCAKCGAVYHTTYHPASVDNICDVDGCELQLRPDDDVETIKKRLAIYTERTAPLIGFYQEQGLVYTVDAARSIEEVRNEVLERLGQKLP